MKKIILALAVVTMVVSCKKISEGGNEGRLKMEEGTTRYSDDEQGVSSENKPEEMMKTAPVKSDSASVKTEVPAAQPHSSVNSMSAPVNHGATQTK